METIQDKINRFYSLIKDYKEGAPNTRYKSWEWCHQAFLDNRNNNSEENIEFLSLHLAFYLASWGMYRGSSYLLQRDYKAHKVAVSEIIKPKYSSLWNYVPTKDNIESANDLLFDAKNGLYWKIKTSYKGFDETDEDESSDTLTTKILMGTFGCVPAFDRFLKSGIKCYQNNHEGQSTHIGGYKLTQSIEKANGTATTESFKALASLVIENPGVFQIESDFYYPPMKCLDMYFWEVGFEMETAKLLVDCNKSYETKAKAYSKAVELGCCNAGLSFEEVSNAIKALNLITL